MKIFYPRVPTAIIANNDIGLYNVKCFSSLPMLTTLARWDRMDYSCSKKIIQLGFKDGTNQEFNKILFYFFKEGGKPID